MRLASASSTSGAATSCSSATVTPSRSSSRRHQSTTTPSRCRPWTRAAVVSMPPSSGPRSARKTRCPRLGQHAGGFQAGRPAADDQHRAGGLIGDGRVAVVELVAAAGLDDAGDDRIPVVPHHAGLVAQQAGADSFRLAAAQPRDQVRIGDLRPGHLRQIGGPVVQRPLRLPRVDHAALQGHGDGSAYRGPDLPAQLGARARLGMQVGPGRRHRVDRPPHHHEIVRLAG